MPVWRDVKEKEKDNELYSSVAELYHEFRPRYPEALLRDATRHLPDNASILEIGSGPATATLPLLQRGYHLTCIEPASGMIAKAKQVCRDYVDTKQVSFHQMTLQDYLMERHADEEQNSFDDILAATSFHWAMDDKGEIVKKCHELLKPHGKLLFLWNIPPKPKEALREAVATATSNSLPFYFSGYSTAQHVLNIQDKVLSPVEHQSTVKFTKFSHQEYPTQTAVPIDAFLSMVCTFSFYIKMTRDDRESFMDTAKQVVMEQFGPNVEMRGLSVLNMATKIEAGD